MRLVKLSVQRFQCIESAELELGPHLNVLYGPNDLGKSSLVWAIRAVLLLQHGSSHAARFSSWYDDGDPRVALTFCDDDGWYWRVTKVFGGSAGRSTLESSKDGKTFSAEGTAREVDKRLRQILRWGLAAPGGQGRTAMPASFLTQVLLADQTEGGIRNILFNSKLEDDPDESGRQRLIAALGALAQDPLFKQVLDETTEHVDSAFSSTGRRRRNVGSPWVDVADRIKSLRHDQEQLEGKVKDSAAVEMRIRQLHEQRDRLHAQASETAEVLEAAQRQLAVKKQRDILKVERAVRQRKIDEVETLAAQIASATTAVDRLAADHGKLKASAAEAQANAAREDAGLEVLRAAHDAVVHDNPDAERAAAELQASVTAAEARVREATAAVGTCTEALRAASQLVAQLVGDEEAARAAGTAADAAETHAAQVGVDLERAQHVLDDAREQQRAARSNDRAQARELRRQELENRRLTLGARRTQVEQTLRRAHEIGQQLAAVAEAEKTAETLGRSLASSRAAAGADEAELGKLDTARAGLARLDAYGRYRMLREQVGVATEASDGAERERARANELRERVERLRGEARPGLPAPERLAALRRLREDLRIAEAALGGGLSVIIRPRRPVELRTVRDGVAEPVTTTAEPVTHTARRLLALGVGDLLDIEITAGEEAARTAAAELRGRWLREGESTLVEHQVSTLEELDAARARADAVEREISDCLREVALVTERATPAADLAALREQLAAAEAELGAADREDLALRLARLGDPWQTGLRRREKELEAELATRRTQLDTKRAATARLEAQVEAQQAEVRRLGAEVAAAQAVLAEPWAVVVATSQADLKTVSADQSEVDQQLVRLVSGTSDDGAAADAALVAAQAKHEEATAMARRAQADAQAARVTQAKASARVEASRSAARQLDAAGAWTKLLDEGSATLPLVRWEDAVRGAQAELASARAALVAATTALAEARAAREASVQAVRQRVQEAEVAARAARRRAEESHAAHQQLAAQHSQAVVALAEMRVQVASVNLDETRRQLADLSAQLAALEPGIDDPRLDDAAVAEIERMVTLRRGELRDLDDELARASGALEQVGGAIVRERLDEIGKAIARALDHEHELEVEYEAWRLLQTSLRESESTETAHLGRTLAGPVTERFRQLTGGRYGDLELGAHLEAGGIHVAGDLREIGSLSAGTQDQLATLLRVCVAQQLQSAIVLDDHLSQSDVGRVAWFNTMLREAAAQVQIVLITCRPQDVLAADELAGAADGPVRAIDLSTVIRRFAAAPAPSPRAAQRSRA